MPYEALRQEVFCVLIMKNILFGEVDNKRKRPEGKLPYLSRYLSDEDLNKCFYGLERDF